MFFCFRRKEEEKRAVGAVGSSSLFVRVSKMAKKSYQKMQPMTAKEKQLRAAEAAGVAQFYIKKFRATCAASCGSARLIECTKNLPKWVVPLRRFSSSASCQHSIFKPSIREGDFFNP